MTTADEWKRRLIRAGVPATLANYRKIIETKRPPDLLTDEEILELVAETQAPKGWGSTTTYME